MSVSPGRLLARAVAQAAHNSFSTSAQAWTSPALYVDKGLIVINKPSGLVCQSDKSWEQKYGRKCGFDLLLDDLKKQFNLVGFPKQLHRLDMHTTGAYILAKSSSAVRDLSFQFRKHSIKKTYIALVRGGRKSFPLIARGTINTPIGDENGRAVVDPSGEKLALTDWKLLGSSEKVPLSVVHLTLHTGMKHQLRFHLAHTLKTPILGDTLYSSKPPSRDILDIIPKGISVSLRQPLPNSEERPGVDSERDKIRIFLHSAHIGVTRYRNSGPSKRLRLGVNAPLPQDFMEICDAADLSQYLPKDYIEGGMTVDGKSVSLSEEIEGIEGRWVDGERAKKLANVRLLDQLDKFRQRLNQEAEFV